MVSQFILDQEQLTQEATSPELFGDWRDECRALRAQGMTVSALSQKFQCSISTIKRWAPVTAPVRPNKNKKYIPKPEHERASRSARTEKGLRDEFEPRKPERIIPAPDKIMDFAREFAAGRITREELSRRLRAGGKR